MLTFYVPGVAKAHAHTRYSEHQKTNKLPLGHQQLWDDFPTDFILYENKQAAFDHAKRLVNVSVNASQDDYIRSYSRGDAEFTVRKRNLAVIYEVKIPQDQHVHLQQLSVMGSTNRHCSYRSQKANSELGLAFHRADVLDLGVHYYSTMAQLKHQIVSSTCSLYEFVNLSLKQVYNSTVASFWSSQEEPAEQRVDYTMDHNGNR